MKIQLILYITANGKRQSTDRSAIHAIPISVYTPIIVSTACTFWRRCKASYHGDRRVKTHRIYISADAKPTEATKSAHHLNPATSRENCNVNVNVDFEASNAVTINCHTFSIRSWCCSNIHQFNVIVNTEYRIAVTVVVVPLPLSSLSLPSLQGTGLTQGHRGRSMHIGRRSERIRTMREHFSDTGDVVAVLQENEQYRRLSVGRCHLQYRKCGKWLARSPSQKNIIIALGLGSSRFEL